MTRNTKFFFLACGASVALFFLLITLFSTLRDLFFWRELAKLSNAATATVLQEQLEETRPTQKPGVENPDIQARSAFSLLVTTQGSERVLFARGADRQLPIASLTKLMTALVALEFYTPEEKILVSESAIAEEGNQGGLSKGQTISVQDILYPLLLESSNDAAMALAEHGGKGAFINRMNHQASLLRLTQTLFVNPNGLDPEDEEVLLNVSSARNLAKLTRTIKETHPEIFDILSLPKYGSYTNTNEFLRQNNWRTEVLGGKTGWTDKARGCLVLILQSPKNKGYTINVVLGAEDRFEEMRKLVDWTHEAYTW